MPGGIRKPKGKETESERIYLHEWYALSGIILKKNKPIAKGMVRKENLPEVGRYKTYSSRTKLQRGIQLYRMWFRFLKLAAELEKQDASIIIRNHYYDNSSLPKIFVTKKIEKIKINKSKYGGWDLDNILSYTWDRWWDKHSHLFEGYAPSIMSKNAKLDRNFIHLKFDPSMKYEDFQTFIKNEVKPKFVQRKQKFEIKGLVRPDQLQNRYNALVLTIKGWTAKDILLDDRTFLRAPDEKGGRADVGGAIEVPVRRVNGKITKTYYSKVRSRFYVDGVFHLLEVCKGKFGEAPKIAKQKL